MLKICTQNPWINFQWALFMNEAVSRQFAIELWTTWSYKAVHFERHCWTFIVFLSANSRIQYNNKISESLTWCLWCKKNDAYNENALYRVLIESTFQCDDQCFPVWEFLFWTDMFICCFHRPAHYRSFHIMCSNNVYF